MSKKSKKRDKPYTGTDAKNQAPTIHHYKAATRSPFNEWWHDHRRIIKLIASIGAGGVFIGWLLLEAIHLVFFNSVF